MKIQYPDHNWAQPISIYSDPVQANIRVLAYIRVRVSLTLNFLGEEGEDQREKERKKINGVGSGIRCGGAVLESSGDDVHILLEHLREYGEELPQGAVQIRSPHSREGPFLHFQMG